MDGAARTEDPQPITWYSATTNMQLNSSVSALVLPIRAVATDDDMGRPLWPAPADFERRLLEARPRLITACLTLLRAYIVAGQPEQKVEAFPRFDAWTRLVSSALVWAGEGDPLSARKPLADYVDDDRDEIRLLLDGLLQIPGCAKGLTTRDILFWARSDDLHFVHMRQAIEALIPGEWWKPRKLAGYLKGLRDKWIGNFRLERAGEDRDHFALWTVRIAAPATEASVVLPPVDAANDDWATPVELPPAALAAPTSAESAESLHVAEEPLSLLDQHWLALRAAIEAMPENAGQLPTERHWLYLRAGLENTEFPAVAAFPMVRKPREYYENLARASEAAATPESTNDSAAA